MLHVLFDFVLNMVFNVAIPLLLAPDMSTDKKIIEDLGGPAAVAELLGYEKHGGVQRVQNWLSRGIPPKVKVERPDLFMKPALKAARASR